MQTEYDALGQMVAEIGANRNCTDPQNRGAVEAFNGALMFNPACSNQQPLS